MFNIGDQVVIREDSRYYNKSSDVDPDNSVIGIVIDTDTQMDYEDETYPIRVKWGHRVTNIYRERDLELISGNYDIEDWV